MKKHLFLLICPGLLVCLFLITKQNIGPYWLGSNSDPEYAYLLNSLNLVNFKPVGHIDHPGTPLQILGAIVIKLTSFFRNQTNVNLDVLNNPEIYLNNINYVIFALIVLSNLLIGYFIYQKTNKPVLSLLLQLTPFYSTIIFDSFYRISPEPMLIFVNLWFSYFILLTYLKSKPSYKFTIALGFIMGLSIAIKINSIPLIIIPLIVLNFKNKILFLLITLFSFIISTLPIINKYYDLYNWFSSLVIHTGRYGSGTSTYIDLPSFIQNSIFIIKSQPITSFILIFFLVYSILSIIKRKSAKNFYYLISIFIFLVMQIATVSKHYAAHYLIPSLSVSGLSLVLILLMITNLNKKIIQASFIIIMLFCVYNYIQYLHYFPKTVISKSESSSIRNIIQSKYPTAIKIYYYRSSSQEYALKFGNDFALSTYSNELSQLYPNTYFYNIQAKTYSDWQKDIEYPTITDRNVIFQGTPFIGEYQQYKPDIKLNNIFNGFKETFYFVVK